nr:hypothetical protein [Mycoplasmopsis bovis]
MLLYQLLMIAAKWWNENENEKHLTKIKLDKPNKSQNKSVEPRLKKTNTENSTQTKKKMKQHLRN